MKTLVGEATQVCLDQMARLAALHDQIYGGGGRDFVSGPYLADLERAVLTRVRPEIDRQVTALERRKAEERARQEAAEIERARRVTVLKDTQKLLIDAAYECANAQVARLVRSGERAEIIAEAAMTICAKDVRAAVEAVNNTTHAETGSFRPTFESDEILRAAMRKNIQANAVVARAERSGDSRPSQSAPVKQPGNEEKFRECLATAHTVYSKSTPEKAPLIRSMMELCRPEIEVDARNAFLQNPSIPLDDARADALKRAAEFSDSLIGTRN